MNPEVIYALTGVLAVLLGGMIVFLPVLGLTLRYALRPLIEHWTQHRRDDAASKETALLQRQVHLLETELQQVQHTLKGLTEEREFLRLLREGESVSSAASSDNPA